MARSEMSRSSPLVMESRVEDRPRNAPNRLGRSWLLRLWLPGVLLGAWELAVALSWLDPLFFPPPSKLLSTAIEMLRSGDLGEQIRSTAARTGAGFLLGALAGIGCGILMGVSDPLRRSIEPLTSALYNAPKLTLLPMLMVVAGTGEMPLLILIATAVFLQVLMHTLDGVKGISPHYVEMAVNHGATRWLLFRRVYLPATGPQVFTGLRLGMGRALGIAISAELLMGAGGLGGLVWRSWQTFSIERLYVAVAIAALLGAAIHQSLKLVEARILPWRSQ
jgi:ABC-type nitrate/sulfonate/bicarbonate transport system permease component